MSEHCRLAATLLLIAAIAASLTTPANAVAQQTITWKHGVECKGQMTLSDVGCTPVFQRTAQDGEKITLRITDTCPNDFEYTVVPVPLPESDLRGVTECKDTKTVDIQHDAKYGGYIVHIVKKKDAQVSAATARLTIAVRTSEWKTGFAGGFSINGLIDPAYALREIQVPGTGTTTTTKYVFINQGSRKDGFGRSVASFVHLHHTKWELSSWFTPGISFGLGVEPDRGSDYYIGPSWLFGDRAAFTVGMVTGQVKSPPSGRQVNDTLTDANALANLGRRRTGKFFVALSYRFLGGGADDLKKPFAGSSPPGTTSAGSGGAASPQPSTTAISVEKVNERPQQLKAGDISDTLRIKATDAPNATIRWLYADGSEAAPSGKTDAQGVAKTTIKLDSHAAEGIIKVRAFVSTSATPIRSGFTDFELTIKK